MAPDEMAAFNAQLAAPPEFDLASSDQLGLFVTGKLAARHGIRVTLRVSPYRGTTAIVVLPWEIIVPEHEADAWFRPGGIDALSTAAASPGRGPAFGMTGRHRLEAPPSSPEDGGVDGIELVRGPQVPTGWPMASTAVLGIGPTEPNGDSVGVTGPPEVAGSPPGRPANGTATGGTYLGLPRRVRQASLAPQLRGRLGAEPATSLLDPGEAAEPPALSPEQTSSRLSALQDGWLRGRLDDLDDPSGPDLGGGPDGASGGYVGPDDRGVES
jgi:hypothetical protein